MMSQDEAVPRARLYTDQLVVLVRRAVGVRIKAAHKSSGLSQAEVIRRAIDHGLGEVEKDIARQAAEDQRALAS